MKMLYIIRGIPGSGKSTLAKKIASVVCEADDFFVDPDGVYRFDPSLLKEAHSACQKKCVTAMQFEVDAIAVANTFTRNGNTFRTSILQRNTGTRFPSLSARAILEMYTAYRRKRCAGCGRGFSSKGAGK